LEGDFTQQNLSVVSFKLLQKKPTFAPSYAESGFAGLNSMKLGEEKIIN
jgi:hypothetical protein